MALLEEINYNPSEDSMQDAFDKINGVIQTINAVLGGGTTGQQIQKVSGSDFDTAFVTPSKAVVIDRAESFSSSTGTGFTTATVSSPSDKVRNSVVHVSLAIFCTVSTRGTINFRKDGSLVEAVGFTTIDTDPDISIQATVVSFTFTDLLADPGSEYEVFITTTNSATLNAYSLVLQSIE